LEDVKFQKKKKKEAASKNQRASWQSEGWDLQFDPLATRD
jgi:hypothetical protein